MLIVFFKGLKAVWIQRILKNDNNVIGNTIINNFGPNYLILRINDNNNDYIRNINPPFYKQVIEDYIDITSLDRKPPDTCTELLNQPIWSNTNFTIKNRSRHPRPIYLSNWIKNGIVFVKDLVFSGSNVDAKFLLDYITVKNNIFIEILELKNALKPYAKIIQNISEHDRPIDDKSQLKYTQWKSRQFYDLQINHISENPSFKMQKHLFHDTCESELYETIYIKVKNIPDKKLAEFNFKILHSIMICGKYLNKWDNSVSKTCNICNTLEDIQHILYECTLANCIWNIANNVIDTPFTKRDIILHYTNPVNNHAVNFFITIISYCIYKFWVICHNQEQVKNKITMKFHMISDLRHRIIILNSINNNCKTSKLLRKFVNLLASIA